MGCKQRVTGKGAVSKQSGLKRVESKPMEPLETACPLAVIACQWLLVVVVFFAVSLTAVPTAQAFSNSDNRFAEITSASKIMPGFLPLYWHADQGRLYVEVTALDAPFIYFPSLSEGVGSNDLGLDRGRLGETQLVQFERIGPRVLLMALNTRYRASSDNPAEQRAVKEAFARSVLWGFELVAERDGRLLIDITDFAQTDAMGVAALLGKRKEGTYRVDSTRSVVNLNRTRAFPDNTEVDAIVTLVGEPEGDILPTVTPDARRVSMHIHHSFVRLPDDGYTPLPYDPRAGYIDGGDDNLFNDYGTPIDQPIKRGYAWRHRLAKVDPTADRSEAVDPIVYYVDPGVPEPIRSALTEGASWWNQAFEAAGYIDAFQVRLLPEDADPMDVRYNVIQWVHRSTRGWSYGMSVRDPRTQEIIKGHVSLGSLRVRQDYLIAEGLLAPYGDDDAEAREVLEGFALARIRQLAAHEVGHTLGLEHNFAASADDRASVMDYPYPYVTLNDDGEIDVSQAYATGIGEWDKRAITWGYADFKAGQDPASSRAQILARTLTSGLSFVADQHARNDSFSRGAGPCHSRGSLWDNGADPVAELDRLMALRAVVLQRFSEKVIQTGQPLARIEEVLVPAYLMHRYQVQAAATVLGGRDFTYAMKGDGQIPTQLIDPERQQAALSSLLRTLQPDALTLAPELVRLIPPRPPLSGASRELFPRESGYLFDPISAAGNGASLTLDMLLDPTRAARMNNQRALSSGLPGFSSVLAALINTTWAAKPLDDAMGEVLVQRRVQTETLSAMVALLNNKAASREVRAQVYHALSGLEAALGERLEHGRRTLSSDWKAHYAYAMTGIGQALGAEDAFDFRVAPVPPGSPI